MVNMLLIYNTI